MSLSRNGVNNTMFGKVVTADTRAKLSVALKVTRIKLGVLWKF
jgi:hypothetical protein